MPMSGRDYENTFDIGHEQLLETKSKMWMQIVISRDLYKTIQVEYVWGHSFYMEDLVLDL